MAQSHSLTAAYRDLFIYFIVNTWLLENLFEFFSFHNFLFWNGLLIQHQIKCLICKWVYQVFQAKHVLKIFSVDQIGFVSFSHMLQLWYWRMLERAQVCGFEIKVGILGSNDMRSPGLRPLSVSKSHRTRLASIGTCQKMQVPFSYSCNEFLYRNLHLPLRYKFCGLQKELCILTPLIAFFILKKLKHASALCKTGSLGDLSWVSLLIAYFAVPIQFLDHSKSNFLH